VVVENFRPGVLDRLGISGAEFRAERPELVWCAISGFGQDGPYRDKPAYDMIVQALSGGMSLTGEPGRGAVRAGIPIGDLAAGMYAAIGILAALNRRRESGEGASIDISMLDCQVAMLSYQAAYYLHSGKVPGRQGAHHDSIPTYRTFIAGDGCEVVVTANTERMWQGLARVLGLEALIVDPRFADNAKRFANREELWRLLGTAFRERPADEWIALLEKEEVPVAAVNTLDQVLSDAHVRGRSMVLDLERDGRRAALAGNPLQFVGEELPVGRFPPTLGEDTLGVLGEVLGLRAGRLADLAASGVIATASPQTRTT
jgi:CoA:oxalate CoA-transferase